MADRQHRPALPARGTTTGLVLAGSAVFVLGLLLFADMQTQALFREAGAQITPGSIPRNDSGILFGAIVAAAGLSLVLASLSPRPAAKRLGPAAGLTAATASLLFAHFTIFVNGFIVPSLNSAAVEASFAFHDAAAALPIATFVLALVTALLIGATILFAMALVAPDAMRTRLLRVRTLEEHRTRVALLTLALLACGAGFLRQFFAYALTGDAQPSGHVFGANLYLLAYYTLSLTLLGALGTTAWRAYTLTWGDLRDKPSRSFRRFNAYLAHTETWLWGTTFVLNGILLLAEPVYTPGNDVDRVFAMNSKGVSIFFLLVFGLYALQRLAVREELTHMRAQLGELYVVRRDNLLVMSLILIGGWALLAAISSTWNVTSLSKLILRFAFVALVLPLFALRLDIEQTVRPAFRTRGGPAILFAGAIVAILTGIMLWGVGNTVTTVYSRNGGFYFPEENVLQPYATGIRILGSLFIAAPLTTALWMMAIRFKRAINPGPLIVAGLSVVLAMNLLFTINAHDLRDPSVRTTEVLVGFASVSVATLLDKVVVLTVFSATAAIGVLAMARLMHQGVDRRHTARAETT